MNSARIAEIVAKYGLRPFRGEQLRVAFFRQYVDSFAAITTLDQKTRELLTANEKVLTVTPGHLQVSRDGRAHKALMKLHDGRQVETVLLNPKPGLWSCCISSQVGCALACTFCATGKLGFSRNLSNEEISDQVLFWRQYIVTHKLDAQLSNVVFMGEGEPFQNKVEVFAALGELMNNQTFNIGSRHLSVSTVGILRGIEELAEQYPQVNLAVSLHAANNTLRESMMPVNRGVPLEKLAAAMNHWLTRTNRKIFIEYILLRNVNDTPAHAAELVAYLATVGPRHLVHVNLIAYNSTGDQYQEPSGKAIVAFRDFLNDHGLLATVRNNLGRDIAGACGQLALQGEEGGAKPGTLPAGASMARHVEVEA